MNNKILYNYFNDDDFLTISNKIKEMEKITAGEIRVAIKEMKPLLKKKSSILDLAKEEFHKLKMNQTRDKTGILLYMLLKEKQFYILADSGINEKVEQTTWNDLRDKMQIEFKDGHFLEGLLFGIEKVGNILGKYFPIKPDDTNELSNKVVL